MNEQHKKHVSKFLSLILRHEPEKIGLTLNENGWADVTELISKSARNNVVFTLEELDEVVATNDKQRFAFDETHTLIRASQGHSIDVELELAQAEPPEFLYHGTVGKFIDSIQSTGLNKMSRQYVHLSQERETAGKVGSRRGVPIILNVKSGQMRRDGHVFYLSENGVWLTEHVPAKYIDF